MNFKLSNPFELFIIIKEKIFFLEVRDRAAGLVEDADNDEFDDCSRIIPRYSWLLSGLRLKRKKGGR